MINYEKLKKQKEKIKYSLQYSSSAVETTQACLGTIEKDASGHFGKFSQESFRGERILKLLSDKKFYSILDVGAGKLEAVQQFIKLGKIVDICEFGDESYYYSHASPLIKEKIRNIYIGDINTVEIPHQYDAVWAAHILEHQLNPNFFLKKIHSLIKEEGFLAIIVPPRKPFIIGGHVNLYNPGLLLYHLILAGFDCSKAQVLQYDYNIGIVLQKKTIKNFPKINYDLGDIEILKEYFPMPVCEGFNGDILSINI